MLKRMKFSLLLAALLWSAAASAQTVFTLDDIVSAPGEATLNVNMANPGEVIVVQCDLKLPADVTIKVDNNSDPIVDLSDRNTNQIAAAAWISDSEVYRILIYSPTNRPVNGNEGLLFSVPLNINCAVGEYTITLCNILVTDSDIQETESDPATCALEVIEPEIQRYGDNQLYVKDMTVTEGQNAEMRIGYNSTTDVYEYKVDIALPATVVATELTFAPVVADVANFTNEWSQEGAVLTVSGTYGGGRKDVPAEGGDRVFATAVLNTASLPAGEYDIVVGGQKLFNDDDFYPESYTAKLVVESVLDGLENIEIANASDDTYYDIMGRRVENPAPGVYIRNGCKVLVK